MRVFAPTALLVLALPAAPASAARSYDNCVGYIDSLPAVISTQGTWCLRADLGTALASGAAITIAANNVTLDCNDFKVGGLAAGPGTTASGIESDGRLNATVRNCTIRGFYRGLRHEGNGSGHLVQDNRLEGNTYMGIVLIADNTIVRDNLIADTGGSTVTSGGAYGIHATGDGIQLTGNTINGVAASPQGIGTTAGIYFMTNNNGGVDIGGNWVYGLTEGSQGTVVGIRTSGRAVIHGNRVHAPRVGPDDQIGSAGIWCSFMTGLATGNQVYGADSPVINCTQSGNAVFAP